MEFLSFERWLSRLEISSINLVLIVGRLFIDEKDNSIYDNRNWNSQMHFALIQCHFNNNLLELIISFLWFLHNLQRSNLNTINTKCPLSFCRLFQTLINGGRGMQKAFRWKYLTYFQWWSVENSSQETKANRWYNNQVLIVKNCAKRRPKWGNNWIRLLFFSVSIWDKKNLTTLDSADPSLLFFFLLPHEDSPTHKNILADNSKWKANSNETREVFSIQWKYFSFLFSFQLFYFINSTSLALSNRCNYITFAWGEN